MRLVRPKRAWAFAWLWKAPVIRSVEQLTGVNWNPILSLVLTVGSRCEAFLEQKIHRVPVDDGESDEIRAYVGCNKEARQRLGPDDSKDDAQCFVAIEFCQPQTALAKPRPAMTTGPTGHAWGIGELLLEMLKASAQS